MTTTPNTDRTIEATPANVQADPVLAQLVDYAGV